MPQNPSIYLFRHGQAGSRLRYDTLSDLGREQARALGRYLAAQKIAFRAVVCGALERQQQTALEAARAAAEEGLAWPEIAVHPDWNEFDLEGVYRDLAPRLCADDAEFARHFEELTRNSAEEANLVHRTWSPCDVALVRAWIEERYPSAIESWSAFTRRVAGALDRLPTCAPGEAVAVFTSATPIAIWTGLTLGVNGGSALRLAAVMYNTAITMLSRPETGPMLFSFNGIPHLPETGLRTFR